MIHHNMIAGRNYHPVKGRYVEPKANEKHYHLRGKTSSDVEPLLVKEKVSDFS